LKCLRTVSNLVANVPIGFTGVTRSASSFALSLFAEASDGEFEDDAAPGNIPGVIPTSKLHTSYFTLG
jgi:hypothetical protein